MLDFNRYVFEETNIKWLFDLTNSPTDSKKLLHWNPEINALRVKRRYKVKWGS